MLFSYGFLEGGKEHIDLMFVNVEIPDDDPLKLPKKVFSKETPIVTLRNAPEPTWTGGIVLWACVNEEDGLDFEMMRTTDGGQELCMTWKGESVKDPQEFSDMLRKDPMWDIFHLRAIVLVMERLESQYLGLRATEKAVSEIRQEEEEDELQSTFRPGAFHAASKLRKLESDMLVKHIGHLTQKVNCSAFYQRSDHCTNNNNRETSWSSLRQSCHIWLNKLTWRRISHKASILNSSIYVTIALSRLLFLLLETQASAYQVHVYPALKPIQYQEEESFLDLSNIPNQGGELATNRQNIQLQ